jgi:hypothetical protein
MGREILLTALICLFSIPAFASQYVVGDLEVGGNITFDGAIYGDGSNLTGIDAGSADLSAVDQGIYPSADNTYDIGSSSYAWQDVYAVTIHGSGAGDSVFTNEVVFSDTNTGANAGTDACIGADGTLCVCGSCN